MPGQLRQLLSHSVISGRAERLVRHQRRAGTPQLLRCGCAVELLGRQSATTTATPGVPLSVSFNLTCFRSGTVRVTAPTSGTDPASYYNILVDGTWAAFVMAGSSASFKAREGSRSVQLIDVPGNCTVTSSNPATVIVVGGGMTDVSFPVSCVANPTLTVTVTTTGTHIPAEFYVGVDYYYYYYYYQYSFTVSANGSGSIRIPPGDHTVYLDGLPGNCAVTSANGISVAMVLGSTRNVSFTVVCH